MICKMRHEEELPSEASNPRSLYLSVWDGEDLTLMSFGGNERLMMFLDQYGLLDSDLKTKYTSQACQFYREKVRQPSI